MLRKVVVMLRKGGKAATTKGITVSADSMLGEQVFEQVHCKNSPLICFTVYCERRIGEERTDTDETAHIGN